MRAATVNKRGSSTAVYHRYFPLGGDVWLVLLHAAGAGRPHGEPAPDPDREWDAWLVQGEPLVPDERPAPAFEPRDPREGGARQAWWHCELLDAVARRFGARDHPDRPCWVVKEARVDDLLDYLQGRAAAGDFAG